MTEHNIEIYMRPYCGFCDHAMQLFTQLNVDYVQYDIWDDPTYKTAMKKRVPNARTVPQIFIDGTHIGGCDDLIALHKNGTLESMLA